MRIDSIRRLESMRLEKLVSTFLYSRKLVLRRIACSTRCNSWHLTIQLATEFVIDLFAKFGLTFLA